MVAKRSFPGGTKYTTKLEDPRVVVRGGYRCCEHGVFLTEELPGAEAPVDQIEAKFTFEPLGAANQGGQGADGPNMGIEKPGDDR